MFKRKETKATTSSPQQPTVTPLSIRTSLAHYARDRVWLLFLLFLIPLLCLISYSAWALSEETVLLEVPGIDIEYGGYETCEMYADGAPAFCAEPSKATPQQGVYAKSMIEPLQGSSGDAHDKSQIIATLWFGWGGPGFDPSLWPSTWYDGTPLNAHRYWALTHIVLADFYTCDGEAALAGCSAKFHDWALGAVLSYVSESSPYDPQAAQSKINERSSEVPSSFSAACFQLDTGSSQMIVSYEAGGWIDLDKDSANTSITAGNENYSLKNAHYAVYEHLADARNDSNRIATLTTDENGYAKSAYLARGTYYVKEIIPSPGYELDSEIYPVEVSKGLIARCGKEHVYDIPAYDTADLILQKSDKETNASEPQGNATLEQAEFQISYYSGFFETIDEAVSSDKLTRTWTFRTNSDGAITLTDPTLLISGEPYYSSSNDIVLPIGTYLIQETKAPQGYLPDSAIMLRTVTQDQGFSAQGTFSPLDGNESIQEQIIRGGVAFNKLDQESLTNTPLGAGTLDAVFEIINESDHDVLVGSTIYAPGEVVYTGQAQTDETGGYSFSTNLDNDNLDYTLPYGTYRIKESMAGAGYLLSDKEIQFSIEEHGSIITLSNEQTFTNQIKRGDIEFSKVRESDQARLAGIPFKITSETTGESHVVITDENGLFSTSSTWNKHSFNTNGNDGLLNNAASEDQATTPKQPDQEEISSPEHNTLSNNTNNEESAEQNAHKRDNTELKNTIETDTQTERDTSSHNGETAGNEPVEQTPFSEVLNHLIKQTAKENVLPASDSAHQPAENAPKASPLAQTGVWFGQTQEGEMVAVHDSLGALPFDTYSIEELPCDTNESYTLVKLEGIVVKKENIALDLGRIDNKKEVEPFLYTRAKDSSDQDKILPAQRQAEIIDHVEYGNLVPGRTYTLKTTVYDHDTEALLPETNASHTFTPSARNGSIEVSILVNTLVAAGHSLTVFEKLYEEDELVCEHKDPNDSEQTLIVLEPKISTFAFDAKDSDSHVSPSTNAHVIDQVSYDNLIANEAYQLIGFIVNPSIASYHTFSTGDLFTQETLQEVRDKLKVDNELFSIATSTFSPEKSEGSTTVDFELNTEALAGKTFVVFEYLVQDDYIIATHTEPGDTKQQFSIETPPEAPSPPTGLGKTYDNPLPLSLGLVCTSALGIALVSRRIRLAKSRKEDILSRIVIP